ncbi:MAG TPA: hypothetical protein DCL21_06730 [Alphaproteobacteria bacterium]|nr:hypothetical protein [Alphaproteobacteria bacterium]
MSLKKLEKKLDGVLSRMGRYDPLYITIVMLLTAAYSMKNGYFTSYYVDQTEFFGVGLLTFLLAASISMLPFTTIMLFTRRNSWHFLLNIFLIVFCTVAVHFMTESIVWKVLYDHLLEGYLVRVPLAIVSLYLVTKLMKNNIGFKWLFLLFPVFGMTWIVLNPDSFVFIIYRLNQIGFFLLAWYLRDDLVYVAESIIKKLRVLCDCE